MRPVYIFVFSALLLLNSRVALAGDAATLVFKSGQMVMIEDGYNKVVDQMRSISGKPEQPHIVELNIGGGSFLLNISEVVIVCRDDCKSLIVRHQLDPARASGKG